MRMYFSLNKNQCRKSPEISRKQSRQAVFKKKGKIGDKSDKR